MKDDFIEIVGAKENNLKGVDVRIPKNQITVFTGVSGSGKSSIVFDTIAQEAGRQLNETYSSFVRRFLPKYRRPNVDEIRNLSPALIVNQKRLGGNSRSTLGTITDINALLRLLFSRFASPNIGHSNAYSFNDPEGMCPKCEGIGKVITMNEDTALDKEKSLREGAILLPGFTIDSYYWNLYAESGFLDIDKKIKDYSTEEYQKLVYADQQKIVLKNDINQMSVTYEGLLPRFMRLNVNTEKDTTKASTKIMKQFAITRGCPVCEGTRYHEKVMTAKIEDCTIYDLTDMQLDKLLDRLFAIKVVGAEALISDIIKRVKSLCDIGLGYLTLTRETPTLSGGESQRVKMVKHLSGTLNGMLYIFDEPSTGLHPRDVYRLNDLLRKVKDNGNTLLVVEHDADVIPIADYIVDVGPKAGAAGGNIMFNGTFEDFLKTDTITSQYLNYKGEINQSPRTITDFYESKKSSLHNLKDVSLKVPKNVFTVVTGVAGSGKSTLVNGVFAKDFSEAIRIDQNPLKATSRSNSATYLGIMDGIRKLFADENKVSKGLFSSNSEGGCPSCGGTGIRVLNMSFMESVEVECTDCEGTRFREDVLAYTYKGKNIVEVMQMTIADALDFFDNKPIENKLKGATVVGLDYLTLGQPLDTLSGGECQRLKLAKELRAKGNIYILDEPTTGLHMSDIKNIIGIINKLVDKGNTVIVIEHNLDIIRKADWIIDIGPEGGSAGGEIVYEGTVNNILECKKSLTARYL